MWLASAWRKGAESLVMTAILLASSPLALARAQAEAPRTLLVMGDSLSAAYNLPASQGWVHLLGERFARERLDWRVVNASISGETTAGGAARIEQALARHEPDLVAIQLGANDALRGLPIELASANLERMIRAARGHGAEVMLIGIRIPPNYGPDYAQALHDMYADLAEEHDLALVPFLLEPIAADRTAFLPDNLHPNAAAQPRLLEHVWKTLQPLLDATVAVASNKPARP
jgi:acyl-CoA thioesterase-1